MSGKRIDAACGQFEVSWFFINGFVLCLVTA
jgi:hypothetical protein